MRLLFGFVYPDEKYIRRAASSYRSSTSTKVPEDLR